VVGDAGVQSPLTAQLADLADGDCATARLQHRGREEADRPRPADEDEVTLLRSRAVHRVVAHRERLEKRRLVEGHVVADGMDPTTLDGDLLAESPAATGESDEPHALGEVVVAALRAGVHAVGDDVRLHDDVLPDLDVIHPLADGVHNP